MQQPVRSVTWEVQAELRGSKGTRAEKENISEGVMWMTEDKLGKLGHFLLEGLIFFSQEGI